jgi:FkbM family methyltransferase
MKILHRNVQITTLPTRFISFGKAVFHIFLTFKRPFQVTWYYLRSTVPPEGFVDLRNGYRITFSGHKHDLISTIIVFCKQDYGKVTPGSVCLDIGANIGLFAMYAVSQNSATVLAFEANPETFNVMRYNIEQNGLNSRILPYNLAVTGSTGEQVAFPRNPSPYNKITTVPSDDTVKVDTINLDSILHLVPKQHVDLLQMDIEGAEYEVFTSVIGDSLQGVDEIRMEYHAGPLDVLQNRLANAGYRIVRHKAEQNASGIIWFKR